MAAGSHGSVTPWERRSRATYEKLIDTSLGFIKEIRSLFLQTTTTTTMSRLPHRPMRTQSRRIISSLSIAFLVFIALICLCPIAAKAEEQHEEHAADYGTVIGIGTFDSDHVLT
jgi:hypothetical protein